MVSRGEVSSKSQEEALSLWCGGLIHSLPKPRRKFKFRQQEGEGNSSYQNPLLVNGGTVSLPKLNSNNCTDRRRNGSFFQTTTRRRHKTADCGLRTRDWKLKWKLETTANSKTNQDEL